MKLYRTLLEAVQHPGITQLGAANGFDVYRIDTYEGAQQFVANNDANTPAGEKWIHDATTFNSHIRPGELQLYFITPTDTNRVIYGVLKSPNGEDVENVEGNIVRNLEANIPMQFIRNDLPTQEPAPEEGPEDEVEPEEDVVDHDGPPEVGDAEEIPPEQVADDVAALAAEIEPELDVALADHNPAAATPSADMAADAAVSTPQESPHKKFLWDSNARLVDAETGEIIKYGDDATQWKTPAIKYARIKNHIKITGIRNGVGTLHIPESIDNLPVTEIAPYAVLNCRYSAIYLPAAIKSIPPYAFVNYTGRVYVARDARTFKYSSSDGADRFRKAL